jgi:hypothetical protein
MKKTVLFLLVIMFSAAVLYAGTGNLIVNQWLGVGGVTSQTPNCALDVQGSVNIKNGTLMINGVSGTLTGAVSGLTIINDSTTPATKVNVTANSIGTAVPSGTLSVDCSQSGLAGGNDLDAGSLLASKWYYIWAIYNGTTLAAVASLSNTNPTLPSNFTGGTARLIGTMRTDGSGNIIAHHQFGNQVFYDVRQTALSGGTATTYTRVDLSAFVPPNAASAVLNADTVSTSSGEWAFLSVDGSNYYWRGYAYYGYSADSGQVTMPMITSQSVWYRLPATTSYVDIAAIAYNLNL